jgi:branched-chain amino acid transport system substrate-binding protein
MKTDKGLFQFTVLLAISIGIGLLLSGILPSELRAAEKEFKIGVVTSFKMECGTSTLKAAEMAAEEINAQGGILGRQIKIFSGNSESDPEKGIMALKRLVEKDKVHILLGGASSGVVLAQMDYLKNYNIIYLAVGVSSPLIAKKVAENYDKYKYEFRTVINALDLCKSIVEDELSMLVKRGYKKFAILREDAAWNRGLVKYIKGNLPKVGGELVTVVDFDPKTIDFAPVFSKIVSSGADVAIPLLAHTDTVTLYKQWHEMKPAFRIVGFDNPGMDAKYWEKTGGACISSVNITWGPVIRTVITPKSIPFFDAYSKKFDKAPHACAPTSYDAVYILADAAKRAGSVETDVLIKALENTDYVGVTGRFVFRKKTHDAIFGPAEYCPFLITQWQQGGKFELLLPKEIATSEYQNPPWLNKK